MVSISTLAKYVTKTDREKITICPAETLEFSLHGFWTWNVRIDGTELCPRASQYVFNYSTFLDATWKQNSIGVMQAMKATYRLPMVAIKLSVSHNHLHKSHFFPQTLRPTHTVRQKK